MLVALCQVVSCNAFLCINGHLNLGSPAAKPPGPHIPREAPAGGCTPHGLCWVRSEPQDCTPRGCFLLSPLRRHHCTTWPDPSSTPARSPDSPSAPCAASHCANPRREKLEALGAVAAKAVRGMAAGQEPEGCN